jgi:hypothetical protein
MQGLLRPAELKSTNHSFVAQFSLDIKPHLQMDFCRLAPNQQAAGVAASGKGNSRLEVYQKQLPRPIQAHAMHDHASASAW